MAERPVSRSPHRSNPQAFRACCRRHIDLGRIAAALCPGHPAAS